MAAPEKKVQLLKMTGICKSFSGVEVLRDASFDLFGGEVHILAGENGAGKSTLIKILAGVHTDYSGRIYLGDSHVRFHSVHDAAARGISVIHQELSLVGEMNVAENIFLAREKQFGLWLNKKAMREKARRLLAELDLKLDVARPLADYPISIRQMVEICKAMAFDSRIVVMDEPTSALTAPEAERLFAIIRRLKERGCGVIYISHKMEEIYRLADRITVLRDGRYIGTSDASQLTRDELISQMVGRRLSQQFPRHQPRPGPIRIAVNDFCVADTRGKNIPAVDSVSFSAMAGEIVGLAGLQGSGSSELLNGLFGTYGRKAKGDIKIDGEEFIPRCPKESISRGVALLTNDRKETGLVMDMSIADNVTLASLSKFSPAMWLRPAAESQAVSKRMQSLKLKASSIEQPVSSLSGGNQQKTVLAKWIETTPKVLLLDEPTRGVDVGAKHEIYELMNNWTSEGITIILITSEMPELLAMSDRIIVMHRGRITAAFSRQEATQEKILDAAMGTERMSA